MKKIIMITVGLIVAVNVFAGKVPDYKTDTLTPTTSQTIANYDVGTEITEYFTFTTEVADTNKLIALVKVPAYSRIVSSEITCQATGSNSTLSVGIMGADGSGYYTGTTTNSTTFFASVLNISNQLNDTFADFAAGDSNAGYQTTKDVYITLLAASEPLVTNKVVKGVVRYIR